MAARGNMANGVEEPIRSWLISSEIGNHAYHAKCPRLSEGTHMYRAHSLSLRSFEEPPYPDESILRLAFTDEENAELIKTDAKNKYFLESHIPAIVWSRKHYGYRIQDMVDRHYFDVTNLIQKYMPSDPLLKTITDPVSVDSYLATIFKWFPKTQSLVAVKEGTREIIGVLIGRLVVEPQWFELVSQIQFVTKKDKYAYLKRTLKKDIGVDDKTKSRSTAKRMSKAPRASQASKRASKTPKDGSKRASKAGSGSRKSMGAKGGSRKSMGAKGGSRKSMGASGGRKSMGAKSGGRKSMGAGGGRKSMGAGGSRKSMGAKGGRKSMGGGSRKSISGGKSGKGGRAAPKERKQGDWKIARPIDEVPEEIVPIVQATVFDDDDVVYPDSRLQSLHSFKKKLAARIRIWKMIKQRMYYRVYLMAISPKYQRMEVDVSLVESLKNMCYSFNVSTIAGIMTTYDAQNAFYNAGGLIVYEVLYKHYPVFESVDPKSYDRSAAVVYLEIPLAPSSPDPGNNQGKKSRGKL